MKEWEQALAALQEAECIGELSYSDWILRGKTFYYFGQLRMAQDSFERAILDAPHVTPFVTIADFYLSQGDPESADGWLLRAPDEWQRDYWWLTCKGRVASANNELDKAVELFQEALAVDVDNRYSYYTHWRLGQLHRTMENPEAAVKSYRDAFACRWRPADHECLDIALYSEPVDQEFAAVLYQLILERDPASSDAQVARERLNHLGAVDPESAPEGQ
jgi:tetratricopeptide (TPR) repeat protein